MKLIMYLCLAFSSLHLIGQCPEIEYIMVDACNGTGSEQNNEFFMISSGDGFNVNDLAFTTPTGTVAITSANNTDFNATNPCPSCMTGCTVNFVTNGDAVPAGNNVIVFTSNALNFVAYDFSGLCAGGSIYVLVANASPGTGQFANYNGTGAPNGCSICNDIGTSDDRSMTLTEVGGCSSSVTYNRCQLINTVGGCGTGDGGAVVFTTGTAAYNNNGCAAPSLPIVMDYFIGKKKLQSNYLEFATLVEVNNDYYTIERSRDDVSFEDIGNLDGAGNSNYKLVYTFEDHHPYSGTSHYRIKQTDFDGSTSYSNVISVFRDKQRNVKVNLKPELSIVNIVTEMNNYTAILYDATGKIIQTFNQLSYTENIDMAMLESGIYFMNVIGDDNSETVKFIKN